MALIVYRQALSERQIQSFARARLASHKAPHRMFVVDSLPRNASGKVLKRVLREQLVAAAAIPAVPGAGATPVEGDEERLVAAVW